MHKLDILRDGPFRYVHCTETGALLTTLVKERNSNLRETGKFVEEEGEDAPVSHTLREWKAILVRRYNKESTHSFGAPSGYVTSGKFST